MTFLEFILTQYLGEPTESSGDGESFWPCPQCGHERFHTMPNKKQYKHRWKCWKCEFRGDAYDWLKFVHDEDWPERQERLAKLREEYDLLSFPPEERGEPVQSDESMIMAEIIGAMLRGINAGVVDGFVFETYENVETQNAHPSLHPTLD